MVVLSSRYCIPLARKKHQYPIRACKIGGFKTASWQLPARILGKCN